MTKETTLEGRYYNEEFYSIQKHSSYTSALKIVPLLNEIIKPVSVLDVGCGLGTWLKVFADCGVKDIFGLDGDHIEKEKLYISNANFQSKDISERFDLGKKFHLVISLEVGEHIPFERSDSYVSNLVRHGDIIFFSAAIPNQGGTHHINEQWQSFWAEKFKHHGYNVSDIVRRKFWNYQGNDIQVHYIQNSMLYIKNGLALENSDLQIGNCSMVSVVHPSMFSGKVDYRSQDVQTQFFHFLKVLLNRLTKRIKG